MTNNVTVHVVMGTTGEYSGRTEWPVCAFFTEELAKERVAAATARAREIEGTRENRYRVPKGINEFDPEMDMDYTGTGYYYYTVQISDPWVGACA